MADTYSSLLFENADKHVVTCADTATEEYARLQVAGNTPADIQAIALLRIALALERREANGDPPS